MALDLSALDASEGILRSGAAGKALKPSLSAPKAPLSAFVEDPNQPRTEFDGTDFDEFAEDIRLRGILQPIMVVELPSGKLQIRFGARRYRAAVRLGLKEVPYNIVEDARQLDDYAQVSENEKRKGLQPLELAMFVSKKLKSGEKKKAVAAKLGIDASAVTHLLALIDGPTFLLELYHSRKCRLPVYLYELKKLHEKNPLLVERRCAEAEEIDRKLLALIAIEISPPVDSPSVQADSKVLPLQAQASSQNEDSGMATTGNLGTSEDHSGTGISADGDPSSASAGLELSQLPFHDPANESESLSIASSNKMKKPLLLGMYAGREVMVLLTRRPSNVGLVHVRYEDGSGDEEVEIGSVSLTMLGETKYAVNKARS
jgi:ParB family chromosome partitioning protein